MLVPLTDESFKQVIPAIATGEQYRYYWGSPQDFLQRLLVAVIGIVVAIAVGSFLPDFESVALILGLVTGLFWYWWPVCQASWRNREFRGYRYAGFWEGEVVDVFRSDRKVGTEETVDKTGRLVLIDKLETQLNLELEDENGFQARFRVPLKKEHKGIRRGMLAQMVVLSNDPRLGRIEKYTDVYLPEKDIWVSDYPYLKRDLFQFVAQRIIRQIETQRRRDDYDRYDESRY